MNTTVMKSVFCNSGKTSQKPKTARGRALFTIAWYANGRVLLRDYDDSRFVSGGERHVHA